MNLVVSAIDLLLSAIYLDLFLLPFKLAFTHSQIATLGVTAVGCCEHETYPEELAYCSLKATNLCDSKLTSSASHHFAILFVF